MARYLVQSDAEQLVERKPDRAVLTPTSGRLPPRECVTPHRVTICWADVVQNGVLGKVPRRRRSVIQRAQTETEGSHTCLAAPPPRDSRRKTEVPRRRSRGSVYELPHTQKVKKVGIRERRAMKARLTRFRLAISANRVEPAADPPEEEKKFDATAVKKYAGVVSKFLTLANHARRQIRKPEGGSGNTTSSSSPGMSPGNIPTAASPLLTPRSRGPGCFSDMRDGPCGPRDCGPNIAVSPRARRARRQPSQSSVFTTDALPPGGGVRGWCSHLTAQRNERLRIMEEIAKSRRNSKSLSEADLAQDPVSVAKAPADGVEEQVAKMPPEVLMDRVAALERNAGKGASKRVALLCSAARWLCSEEKGAEAEDDAAQTRPQGARPASAPLNSAASFRSPALRPHGITARVETLLREQTKSPNHIRAALSSLSRQLKQQQRPPPLKPTLVQRLTTAKHVSALHRKMAASKPLDSPHRTHHSSPEHHGSLPPRSMSPFPSARSKPPAPFEIPEIVVSSS
eukprot:Hpha_TRINITY_DN33450_c0_g1::TRINITY_DN33450_c0_g1_i1::g.722::m.722